MEAKDFNIYLEILKDIGVDCSVWPDNSVTLQDEFLDSVEFGECILTTNIAYEECSDKNVIKFTNTSSEDMFDPVITTFILTNEQYKQFLSKV